jgi:hypothetical protein
MEELLNTKYPAIEEPPNKTDESTLEDVDDKIPKPFSLKLFSDFDADKPKRGSSSKQSSTIEELDAYLNGPPAPGSTKVLTWWKVLVLLCFT